MEISQVDDALVGCHPLNISHRFNILSKIFTLPDLPFWRVNRVVPMILVRLLSTEVPFHNESSIFSRFLQYV